MDLRCTFYSSFGLMNIFLGTICWIDYNKGKGVDMSHQMARCYSPIRKTTRWYHKIVVEVLLNSALVIAWYIYNKL